MGSSSFQEYLLASYRKAISAPTKVQSKNLHAIANLFQSSSSDDTDDSDENMLPSGRKNTKATVVVTPSKNIAAVSSTTSSSSDDEEIKHKAIAKKSKQPVPSSSASKSKIGKRSRPHEETTHSPKQVKRAKNPNKEEKKTLKK